MMSSDSEKLLSALRSISLKDGGNKRPLTRQEGEKEEEKVLEEPKPANKQGVAHYKYWNVTKEEKLKYKADLKAKAVEIEFNPTNNPT